MTGQGPGFVFAVSCSLSNVLMDIAQKKALSERPLLRSIVGIRWTVFTAITLLMLLRAGAGHASPWSVVAASGLLQRPHFMLVLWLDGLLVALSSLGYYRAVQTAPLSLTIPFLTFTPVFLLLSSAIVLHERLTLHHAEGVAVVVFGSMLMYRSQFKVGWTAPLRALLREPGSRYMLLVSVVLSFTNVLDKWLIGESDAYTFAWLYALVSMVLFTAAGAVYAAVTRRRRGAQESTPLNRRWVLLAGLADATTISLQFAALSVLSAVVVISLKRGGIIFAVLAGWWFFREREFGTRLLAASVMICGALMLYLPLSGRDDIALLLASFLLGVAGPRLFRRLRRPVMAVMDDGKPL